MRSNNTKTILGRPKSKGKAAVDVSSEMTIEFGIRHVKKKDGLEELYAVFPNETFEPHRISLTFLFEFTNLWRPIAIGYWLHFEQLTLTTRKNGLQCIKSGFFRFISENNQQHALLSDLTEEFWNSFISWLNRIDATDKGVYGHQTRTIMYNTMRGVLWSLSKTEAYGRLALEILEEFPTRVWSGVEKKGTPRQRLSNANLETLKLVAASELVAIEGRYEEGLRLIAIGKAQLATTSNSSLREKSTFLAKLDCLFPGLLPTTAELRKIDKDLGEASKFFGNTNGYCGYFYPSPRDLVPLVLLLTIALALNCETVLTLSTENFSRMEILGRKFIVIKGDKLRAAEDPVISVPMDFEITPGVSIGRVFDLAENLTARVRSALSIDAHRNRVFIFVGGTNVITKPRGFGDTYPGANMLACTDITFTNNLKTFIKKHSLGYFSLANLRPTTLDNIIASTGDLKAAQALGQQKSPWTLLDHYTSDGTKQRLAEQLGEASFILRERWLATNGLIDPRVDRLGFANNRSSATPGFYCLDPFDSPRPGQRKGKLCAAYGECPDCPLAAASNQVTDVSCYLALRKRVAEALEKTSEKVWRAQWAPVFSSLETLISILPTSVVDAALDFEVKLPALPELG